MRYHAVHFWSIYLGCDAARVSLQDAHGGEHYAIVPQDGDGRQNRQRLYDALDRIDEHIRRGNDPGEVVL